MSRVFADRLSILCGENPLNRATSLTRELKYASFRPVCDTKKAKPLDTHRNRYAIGCLRLSVRTVVGARGFEPPTSRTQTVRGSHGTAVHTVTALGEP